MAKEENLKINEVSFTQREIREKTGFSQSFIKQNIRILIEYEYIDLLRGGNARTRGFYRLKEDENIQKLNFSMIPKPEEMSMKLQKLQSGQTG